MLDITLWIAQYFLALFFLAAGAPKVIGRGLDRWVGFDDMPRPLVVVIGVCEIAAPVALVLPMLAQRAEWTTPLAAIGLTVVSLMASGFHLRQGEWLPTAETALWACLAATIAIGRWNQIETGPSIPADMLVPVMALLGPAIVANLFVLLRQPIRQKPKSPEPLTPTR